jgi:hypothetical protein
VRVEFSELANASINKIFDADRRMTCYASLTFYLRAKRELHSHRCPAFTDLDLYIYPFGDWRVLYEVEADRIFVWSFLQAAGDDE